jgi:hypothetical protein
MPELTRHRYPEVHEECWHIFYSDAHAGGIAIRTGIPWDEDPWGWSCGFYPPSHRGLQQDGTAVSFEMARTEFEQAWRDYLPRCTEADFKAWRDQRDWTARKYAMWDRGERMLTQKPSSLMQCPCGETFDSRLLKHTMIHVPHITKAHQADETRR